MPRRKTADSARAGEAPAPRVRRAPAQSAAASRSRTTAGAGAAAAAETLARLDALAARFEAGCESLTRSLGELPRPDDFQPLADHLYEFARSAPPLLESLQEVPRAAAPIQEAVRALEQLAERLVFAQERFDESLLRLPRAEDYEPLAEPLREFARVSPALTESLSAVLRVAQPLSGAAQEMAGLTRALREIEERWQRAQAPQAAPAAGTAAGASAPHVEAAARQAAECMQAARDAILTALSELPRDPAYTALAEQLRELATVSPSLMDWLQQTPALTAPLTASVEALQAAATALEDGRRALVEILDAAPPA